MKRINIAILSFACVVLTSCGVKKEGLVIMTDQSYKATMFATNKIGIGSPDGLVWHKGTLYFADEGGLALESWSRNEGLKRLMDGGFGCQSPEDLVIDAQGNIRWRDISNRPFNDPAVVLSEVKLPPSVAAAR